MDHIPYVVYYIPVAYVFYNLGFVPLNSLHLFHPHLGLILLEMITWSTFLTFLYQVSQRSNLGRHMIQTLSYHRQ